MGWYITIMCVIAAILSFICTVGMEKKYAWWLRVPGIISIIGCLVYFYISLKFGSDVYHDITAFSIGFGSILIGFVGCGFQIAFLCKADKISGAIRLKENAKLDNSILYSFYKKCMEKGVTDLASEAMLQKAILIGKEEGVHEKQIQEAFNGGRVIYERAEIRKKEQEDAQELEKCRNEDYAERDRREKYARYEGIEKRRAFLENALAQTKEAIKENARDASYYTALGKGVDPAIAGGIASAIGGAGAGIYAAAKTSIDNAKNAESVSAIKTAGIAKAYTNRKYYEKQEALLRKQLDELKYKPVSKHTAQECFEKLDFKDTKITVTKAGSCVVEATVSLGSFFAFEGMPSIIDGSVFGHVYDGDRQIGTATLVFGPKGLAANCTQHIKGIALFCGVQDGKYRVEFAPNKLWAMEKLEE